MNIVIIVQARTGSSRLPGKVLFPLAGEPLLLRMIERVRASELGKNVVVATTIEASDDPIDELCSTYDIPIFRGHPTDLLDRHYKTAKEFGADIVVKIPSDCPLIDAAVIDRVIKYYLTHDGAFDFVSNLHPATYPDGNDVEIMPIEILHTAWLDASKDYEREHTTPFIWEHPEQFRIGNVLWETELDYSMSHRFTIDYPEDYEFIRRVYDELCSSQKPIFSLTDILELLGQQPEILEINAKYAGVNWYRNHLNELRTINEQQTKFAPNEEPLHV
ncbi:MAG TPA: glycosyltransferase family protein [Candidatus Kapabacteria bacterium]|nr:glycosyltransferase family protein [Candidatus Kapabacteria bacterium]